jgi:hypothetical protein
VSAGRAAVSEKGGDFVQKPIRYYITKSGEEPTVRSVKIALNAPDDDARPERGTTASDDALVQSETSRTRSVTRRVKSVIRNRTSRS